MTFLHGPIRRDFFVEDLELIYCLSCLTQQGLGHLTLIASLRVVLSLEQLDIFSLALGDDPLLSDLGLNRFEELLEYRVAKKDDVVTALAVSLVLEFLVVLVRHQGYVMRSNQEESFTFGAFTTKETAGALGQRRSLGTILGSLSSAMWSKTELRERNTSELSESAYSITNNHRDLSCASHASTLLLMMMTRY